MNTPIRTFSGSNESLELQEQISEKAFTALKAYLNKSVTKSNVFRKVAVLYGSNSEILGRKTTMIQREGIKAFAKEKDGGNFHKSFVDLNPDWSVNIQKRRNRQASEMINKIKISLSAEMNRMQFEEFKNTVSAGKRFTPLQIMTLTQEERQAYREIVYKKENYDALRNYKNKIR